MASKNGWIKIFRDIQDNWIWKDKPFSKGQAWIDLILLAKHEDEKFTDRRGNIVQGKRGYIYKSENYFSERWGWSRHKVSRFLSQLQRDGMLEIDKKRASERTSVFIVNYNKFQTSGTSKRTSEGQVGDKSGTSEGQVGDIYKNVKNDKECKEEKEEYAALPAPDEEEYFDLWNDEWEEDNEE